MANTLNGTVSTKYLDWGGLQRFWTNAKAYIAEEIGKVNTALTNKINANDAAIRAYVETLTVNGVHVTSTKDETSGLGIGLTLDVPAANIDLATKLDAGTCVKVDPSSTAVSYGEAGDVETALHQLDTRVDAVEDAFTKGVVNSLTVTNTHDTTTGDTTTEWVKTTTLTKATGEVSIDVDDTAIDSKFEDLDREIVTLQANSGVVGIEIVDSPTATGEANLVEFTMDVTKMDGQADDKVAGHESYRKGLLKLTVNETNLNSKVTDLETADSNEADSRKADIELLAGDGYTAGTAGNVGSWADANKPTYKTIAKLSQRLDEIDENVVTQITENGSVENYVALTVTPSTNTNGDAVVNISISDSALKTKIDTMDQTHTDYATAETNARKAADKLLAGSKWDDTKNTWDSTGAPEYQDITEISAQLQAHKNAIDALSTATHFIGVSSTAITHDGTEKPTINGVAVDPASGDVVIYNHKEFIYSAGKWVELGDTTVENQKISALETWVDTAIISNAEIDSLFGITAGE